MKPESATQKTEIETKSKVLILQWLTYALWGWSIVSLTSLLAASLSQMITGTDTSGFAPYGIAASVVLVPIAVVCDFFYAKREQARKSGIATFIMVVHAVVFALLGIGSLIGAVFSGINLLISGDDSSGVLVALITLSIVAVLFGSTFLRVLQPTKFGSLVRWVHSVIILTATVTILVLSFIGPVRYGRLTKSDRLISENISGLASALNDYGRDKNTLPENLQSLSTNDGTQKLIQSGLVTYTPNTKAPKAQTTTDSYGYAIPTKQQTFFYTLCVNYKKPSSKNAGNDASAQDYTNYVSAYTHTAGNVCYKVATDYNYS